MSVKQKSERKKAYRALLKEQEEKRQTELAQAIEKEEQGRLRHDRATKVYADYGDKAMETLKSDFLNILQGMQKREEIKSFSIPKNIWGIPSNETVAYNVMLTSDKELTLILSFFKRESDELFLKTESVYEVKTIINKSLVKFSDLKKEISRQIGKREGLLLENYAFDFIVWFIKKYPNSPLKSIRRGTDDEDKYFKKDFVVGVEKAGQIVYFGIDLKSTIKAYHDEIKKRAIKKQNGNYGFVVLFTWREYHRSPKILVRKILTIGANIK